MIRLHHVSYNTHSGTKAVDQGVPQGLHLSPLLFLIYAVELITFLQILSTVEVTSYADETNIPTTIENFESLAQHNEVVYAEVIK